LYPGICVATEEKFGKCVPNRDELTGEWREPHSEELSDLYCPPTTVRVIKSRRMKCSADGEERGVNRALVGKRKGKKQSPQEQTKTIKRIHTNKIN
jgi:hypothetical protein